MGEGEKQANKRIDGRGWVVLFLLFFSWIPGFWFFGYGLGVLFV
jgi:hypothetical protein